MPTTAGWGFKVSTVALAPLNAFVGDCGSWLKDNAWIRGYRLEASSAVLVQLAGGFRVDSAAPRYRPLQ